MHVVFRAEAAEDTSVAYRWYEGQRPGLGTEFLGELDRVLGVVTEIPDGFPEVRDGLRRALLRRFPYALYYCRRQGVIDVVACLRMRRNR